MTTQKRTVSQSHDLAYQPLTPTQATGTCTCTHWQTTGTPAHVIRSFVEHVRQANKTRPEPSPEPAPNMAASS